MNITSRDILEEVANACEKRAKKGFAQEIAALKKKNKILETRVKDLSDPKAMADELKLVEQRRKDLDLALSAMEEERENIWSAAEVVLRERAEIKSLHKKSLEAILDESGSDVWVSWSEEDAIKTIEKELKKRSKAEKDASKALTDSRKPIKKKK